MKIAFAYPFNRSQLLEDVLKGKEPDNALYGYNHIKNGQVYLIDVNEKLEKTLNFLLFPLNWLFLKQIDIDFKLARAILMIPKLNNADVIVSNIDGMSLAICFLKKLKLVSPRLIYSVGLFYINGAMVKSLEAGNNNRFQGFYEWILSAADHILYHAEIEKEKLQTLGLYNPATCTFMPMGSDNIYFRKKAKTIKSNLVVAIGKDRGRDYKTLVIAARGLSHLEFIIVCRPSNIPKINIPPNVQFLIDIPYKQIKDLYGKAVMVVIPMKEMRRSSGQMTLTDGIQAQIPVIVSDVAGIKHYNLENYINALLVRPGSTKELQQAILYLFKNKNLQDKIRNNLSELANVYSTVNYATSLQKVITETLSDPKLSPITQKDMTYLKNIRNKNSRYFLNSDKITNSQQSQWFEIYRQKNRSGTEYMFILKDKNINVGTGAIYDLDKKKSKAKIGRFIVEQSQRGKGYGDVLLKKILQVAFLKLNLKKVELEVLENNKQAIKLYLKHKFKPLKKTSENGKNMIIMNLKNHSLFRHR